MISWCTSWVCVEFGLLRRASWRSEDGHAGFICKHIYPALAAGSSSVIRRGRWQHDRRAQFGGAFDFHPAVMQLDEAVDERQAQSRPAGCAAAAFGGEAVKHIGFHLRRDPGPGIGNANLHVVAHEFRPKG